MVVYSQSASDMKAGLPLKHIPPWKNTDLAMFFSLDLLMSYYRQVAILSLISHMILFSEPVRVISALIMLPPIRLE